MRMPEFRIRQTCTSKVINIHHPLLKKIEYSIIKFSALRIPTGSPHDREPPHHTAHTHAIVACHVTTPRPAVNDPANTPACPQRFLHVFLCPFFQSSF